MKTVTGNVISSDSISLSKATSILAKFASTENGASQTVGAYLRRATAAFSELKSLHKELRVHSSDKRSRSDVTSERDDLTRIDNDPLNELTRANDARKEKNRDKNNKKKSKKTHTAADSTEDEKVEHLQDVSEREEEKKVDNKKRKDEEVGSEERKSKKKKRRQASE